MTCIYSCIVENNAYSSLICATLDNNQGLDWTSWNHFEVVCIFSVGLLSACDLGILNYCPKGLYFVFSKCIEKSANPRFDSFPIFLFKTALWSNLKSNLSKNSILNRIFGKISKIVVVIVKLEARDENKSFRNNIRRSILENP